MKELEMKHQVPVKKELVQTSARHRCAKCGARFVHLALPEGTPDPWPYTPKQPVCPKCDGPLECVSVAEGLYRKRGAA